MTGSRIQQTAPLTIAILIAVGALWQGQAVFAPVVFALFIVALVWPLHRRLEAVLPKLVALAVSVAVIVAVAGALGSLMVWAFSRVGRAVVNDYGRIQSIYAQAVAWLESHGIAVAGLWAEHFNAGWVLRALRDVSAHVNSALSFWLIVLVYVILGLLEVESFGRKARALPNAEAGRIVVAGSLASAQKIRRYMVVRTQMSVVTGVLVWAFAKVVGLPFATEWGVIAFVLNYIPFIGPFIATAFPTLFAMTQFDTWQAVVVVFACLNVIQFVVGSYIEPRVSGSVLAMSPTFVLFAIFFWAFLWGLFGAFIGVPIAIAVLAFCAEHPSSRWLADLFGPDDGAKVDPTPP